MPWKVLRYTGKNTPSATRNSLAVSSMPNHRITSGISASAGMLRIICSVESSSVSADLKVPVSRPSSRPRPPPMAKPTSARQVLVATCRQISPETVSAQKAFTTAHGSGSTRVESQPACEDPCQAASTNTGKSQGNEAWTQECAKKRSEGELDVRDTVTSRGIDVGRRRLAQREPVAEGVFDEDARLAGGQRGHLHQVAGGLPLEGQGFERMHAKPQVGLRRDAGVGALAQVEALPAEREVQAPRSVEQRVADLLQAEQRLVERPRLRQGPDRDRQLDVIDTLDAVGLDVRHCKSVLSSARPWARTCWRRSRRTARSAPAPTASRARSAAAAGTRVRRNGALPPGAGSPTG